MQKPPLTLGMSWPVLFHLWQTKFGLVLVLYIETVTKTIATSHTSSLCVVRKSPKIVEVLYPVLISNQNPGISNPSVPKSPPNFLRYCMQTQNAGISNPNVFMLWFGTRFQKSGQSRSPRHCHLVSNQRKHFLKPFPSFDYPPFIQSTRDCLRLVHTKLKLQSTCFRLATGSKIGVNGTMLIQCNPTAFYQSEASWKPARLQSEANRLQI